MLRIIRGPCGPVLFLGLGGLNLPQFGPYGSLAIHKVELRRQQHLTPVQSICTGPDAMGKLPSPIPGVISPSTMYSAYLPSTPTNCT